MMALIACLVVFILLFRYLPIDFTSDQIYQDVSEHDDVIMFEDITVVQQRVQPPPPPSPRDPEPRPDDEIIEDDEFDFEDIGEDIEELPEQDLGETGEGEVAENPARPPNVRRIVEPSVSRESRSSAERVRIYVIFLVNERGEVEEVEIDEFQVYDNERGEFVTVDRIDPSLIDATLQAAYRWQFRPAEDGGREVRARTRHVFTYGS